VWDDVITLWTMFPHAICGGVLIATVCAVLGVFVVLKRVVFIGIALSQVAAAGIAASLLVHVHPFVGATAFTLLAVTILAWPYETQRIPRDAVLGAVFVLASAASILIVAKSGFGLDEVKALLYGDLILTSARDFYTTVLALVPVLGVLLVFIRPIVYTFVDREQGRVLGMRVGFWELLFFYLLGIAVSGASKAGGALLVFCYLIVPPMTGMLLSSRLWRVMAISVSVAIAATFAGIYLSFKWDLPTNQVVICATCLCLVAGVGLRVSAPLIRRARFRAEIGPGTGV
jgi:ABC-type Mn2+/Zn2+ transport system permease subunit